MRSRGFGRLANVTSIGGKLPIPHQAAYVAGKYAATGWSQTLRVELAGEGIAVSTVTPPPLRNGAPLHAHFNGRREDELRWFTRTLTSSITAVSARRTARAVVRAIASGQGESAVSFWSWLSARSFGLAPNLMSHALAWMSRGLPPGATDGTSSSMQLGAFVVRASGDTSLQQLARRAEADEARYRPEGAAGELHPSGLGLANHGART
jgi:hypothetical protein